MIIHSVRRLPVILVLLILGALFCGHIEDSIYDPEFNVYGTLYSWKQSQEIIVDRTYRMNEPSGLYIDDAIVTLKTTGFTDTLVYNDQINAYQSGYHQVEPAASYELTVAREDFDTLYGRTTVPGDFAILHATGDTITLHDSIAFTKSPGAALYDCTIRELTTYIDYGFWFVPDTADTLIIVLRNYVYGIPSSTYEFMVTAYDSNYFEYHFQPIDSVHACGVVGGIGMFGSSWTVSKPFYIMTEPSEP